MSIRVGWLTGQQRKGGSRNPQVSVVRPWAAIGTGEEINGPSAKPVRNKEPTVSTEQGSSVHIPGPTLSPGLMYVIYSAHSRPRFIVSSLLLVKVSSAGGCHGARAPLGPTIQPVSVGWWGEAGQGVTAPWLCWVRRSEGLSPLSCMRSLST